MRPLLAAYRYLAQSADDIPDAAEAASNILFLPIYAEMTDEMVRDVAPKCYSAAAEIRHSVEPMRAG